MNNTVQATNPFGFPSDIATFVLGICGFLTNGILIIVMILDPLKCFRRPSMYFVISLAFSDFFTSIASCLYAWRSHFPLKYAVITTSVIWASVENSFITILLMAIERLIVVRVPIKAKSIITKRRTFIAIAFAWILSIIAGASVSFSPPYNDYVMFGCLVECFLIILVMLIIYLQILVQLRKASKIFRGKQFTRHRNSQPGKKQAKDQRNLNLVVFYLALVLIITVLPHLILGQIYLGYKFFYPTLTWPIALQYAPYISFPLELLNFTLNSVIYAYRLPQFRAALCYCFKGKNGRRGGAYSSTMHRQDGHASKGNPASSDHTMI